MTAKLLISIVCISFISNVHAQNTTPADRTLTVPRDSLIPPPLLNNDKSQQETSLKTGDTKIDKITANWTPESRAAVYYSFKKYGKATFIQEDSITWIPVGPWKKLVVYSSGDEYDYPSKHKDVIKAVVNYPFKVSDAGKLKSFHPKVFYNSNSKELSVQCVEEAMDFLLVNLVHEIITGAISPEAARKKYAEIFIEYNQGIRSEYTRRLLFSTQQTLNPSTNK